MADTSKLKSGRGTNAANSKGEGRSRSSNKAIIFSVPIEVVEAFNHHAAERFGFRKGSKSELFLAIWEEYTSHNQ